MKGAHSRMSFLSTLFSTSLLFTPFAKEAAAQSSGFNLLLPQAEITDTDADNRRENNDNNGMHLLQCQHQHYKENAR